MGIDAALEADTKLAEGGDPGMSAFDHTAMPTEPVFALATLASDAHFDAALVQVLTAAREVVPLVGMQLVGSRTRAATPAGHSRYRIDRVLEHHRVVPVRTSDAEHQRGPRAIRDEVALAAELAAVGRIGPRVRPPRGLGTLAPSKLTRLKSKRSAPRSSASNSMCTR
jgi:hypothetical protein